MGHLLGAGCALPAGYAFAAVWGALWGSFMNVCIARLPGGESIVSPGSHCRACGAPVRWYDNVPILSYLVLRGRCRACGARFSPRYLLVEALAAAAAAGLWHLVVVRGGLPLPRAALLWLAHFVFVGVLIVVAFVDLATYRIPNAITYPGIPLFTAASLLLPHDRWWDGPAGAVAGYLALRLLSDGYFWLTGREGMGYGDAKLLALCGGFLGWRSLAPTVFVGATVGALIAVPVAIARRRAGSAASIRLARIPFGPFLALGALSYLIFGDPLALVIAALVPE